MNNVRPERHPDLMTLLHAAYSAQAEVESKLEDIGLSLAKLVALQALADAGGSLPLGQLAGRLSCVKSNITQLVDRLESDGFVERRATPGDRRTRLASLTVAGRKACSKGTNIQQEADRELFGRLNEAEAAQLVGILGKLGKD